MSNLIEKLIDEINSNNETQIFEIIKELNKFPIRFSELIELKDFILSNMDKIPLNETSHLIEFLIFFEKFDLENPEENFEKILTKYKEKINYFNPEELVILIYNLSKFRIFEKNLWEELLKIIGSQLNKLTTTSLSKLFLALSMLKFSKDEIFGKEDSAENQIFIDIIHFLSKNLLEIKSDDVFRICISLTKRPITSMQVPEALMKRMSEVFQENLNEYDLYQISHILLLFSETNVITDSLFVAVESEIINNYFEKIDDLKKFPETQINLSSVLEDLSKISFSFALLIRGSLTYWHKFFKCCISLKENISTNTIESLNFIIYRGIDYFSRHFSFDNLNKNLLEDCYKNLDELSNIIEAKIINDKLLDSPILDPFSLMMHFARITNNNHLIWNYISQNVMRVLSNPNFQPNPFILSDMTYGFSTYQNALIAENESYFDENRKNCENFEKSFYFKNQKEIWSLIETQILTTAKYLDATYLTNLMIDLAQVNLELKTSWALLTNNFREFLSKGNYDIDNFINVLVMLKRKNLKDKTLWSEIEDYLKKNIQTCDINHLKKIAICLVKANDTDNQGLFSLIANRFIEEDVVADMNFEHFCDLHIPFALIGIGHVKIWNKFEEIFFKNLEQIKEDKPLLLSTIFSFARLNKGSGLVWIKIANIIKEKLVEFDIEDLGHLGVCFKDNIIKHHNLTKILEEDFWGRFINLVDKNISQASMMTCNNLLSVFKENEIVKGNTKIVKKIEERISELSKGK